jgi:polysaccharide pyruvyl transferase WcaK-like protein
MPIVPDAARIDASLSRYRQFDPKVPVYFATPADRPHIHRFYDTSPISPSGRYLAVTELPYEDRLPVPGDSARVVVVDLHSGREIYGSATTAWDMQVGAHAQWGAGDDCLFFNRLDNWQPFGAKVDPTTGSEQRLSQSVYMVSHSGEKALTPDLRKIALVQVGYGVNVPDIEHLRNIGAPAEDGLFETDTRTGASRLLVSLAEIADRLRSLGIAPNLDTGGLYGFHVKWNRDDSRIMFIVRWLAASESRRRTKNYLITMNADGSGIEVPVDARRWLGGHHPNWCPDGENILMNLRFPPPSRLAPVAIRAGRIARKLHLPTRNRLHFATFRFDGANFTRVAPPLAGSGHPSLHPDRRHLLTDAYPYEAVAFGDGTVPLRLVDLARYEERALVRIRTKPNCSGPDGELRIDPHPAWDRSHCWIAFNACPNGVRQVLLADLSACLSVAPHPAQTQSRPVACFSPSTQFENAGDALINRELIALAAEHARVEVDIGRCPPAFMRALNLQAVAGIKVHRRALDLFARMLAQRLRGQQVYYFLSPGGYHGGEHASATTALKTAAIALLHRAGIKVCLVGVSHENLDARAIALLRRRVPYLHKHLVRDVRTRAYCKALGIRVDGLIPDLAFGAAHKATPVSSRDRSLALSFRCDRPPDAATLIEKAVFALDAAIDRTTSFRFVAQVARDVEPLRCLSEKLQARGARTVAFVNIWEDVESCLAAYTGCFAVVSNRLHALLAGALQGAIPIAAVNPDADAKIAGVMETIGLGEQVFDIGDMEGLLRALREQRSSPPDLCMQHALLRETFASIFGEAR